jgi:PHD/YefM family antitoxin component YafN of YafNO toxin-antitoxin module
VCDDGETIVITSPRRKVVMISLDEYNAMTEVVSCRCHSIKNFTERRLRGAEHAGTEDARV